MSVRLVTGPSGETRSTMRPLGVAPETQRQATGPNDLFEIAGNNSPDLPDDDDETHEPQDYTGDYPLEGEGDEDE